MSHSARDMLRALDAQNQSYLEEMRALERDQATLSADIETAKRELEDAWQHLTTAIVPAVDSPTLDGAAARIQLRTISLRALHARMDEEHRRITTELRALEADARWDRREAIANEATIRLEELDQSIKPLQESIALLDNEPFFSELMRAGYGTDAYTQRFWQASYYRHWKNGDLILERHAGRLGVSDFAGIRSKYLAEMDATHSLRESQLEWRNALTQIQALEQTMRKLKVDAQSVLPRTLAWARGQVREHLGALGGAERSTMLAADEELRVAAVRVSGCEAKREYLERMRSELVVAPLKDLRIAVEKNARDVAKLKRPKNTHRSFSAADYQRRFGKDRKAAWQKRRQRVQEARTRIVEFHAYDRWSPTSDVLWWDVMTDGQLDGNFIPEVRERALHHPQHTYDRAAMASSMSRDDFVGDIS